MKKVLTALNPTLLGNEEPTRIRRDNSVVFSKSTGFCVVIDDQVGSVIGDSTMGREKRIATINHNSCLWGEAVSRIDRYAIKLGLLL